MILHKNYVRATAFENLRIDTMLKGGCILSLVRKERGLAVPTRGKVDVHHLVEGNKRLGHWWSIPLHSWYHRGLVPSCALNAEDARARYGDPLTDGRKAFRACHGFDDRDLWIDLQARLGMSVEFPPSKILPRVAV